MSFLPASLLQLVKKCSILFRYYNTLCTDFQEYPTFMVFISESLTMSWINCEHSSFTPNTSPFLFVTAGKQSPKDASIPLQCVRGKDTNWDFMISNNIKLGNQCTRQSQSCQLLLGVEVAHNVRGYFYLSGWFWTQFAWSSHYSCIDKLAPTFQQCFI